MNKPVIGNKNILNTLENANFKCQKCSICCRIYPGAVFLTEKDTAKIANFLKLSIRDFLLKYCRGIERNNKKVVSLKEKPNYDCIFWNQKCIIYTVRPLQCITYPFWPAIVESKKRWKEESQHCKGIDKEGGLTTDQKLGFYLKEKNAVYKEYKL